MTFDINSEQIFKRWYPLRSLQTKNFNKIMKGECSGIAFKKLIAKKNGYRKCLDHIKINVKKKHTKHVDRPIKHKVDPHAK